MLFREIYSVYYRTVSRILAAAVEHPVSDSELWDIVKQYGFEESTLTIPSALREERWQLLHQDGTTPILHTPTQPLTILQKQWLKAIAQDPRIRLFGEPDWEPQDVEPLFLPEDFAYFDQYADGDPYENPAYVEHFRQILDAIRKQYPLSVELENRRGGRRSMILLPEYLEYSEKDDKFRVVGLGERNGQTLNLARILDCSPSEKQPIARKDSSARKHSTEQKCLSARKHSIEQQDPSVRKHSIERKCPSLPKSHLPGKQNRQRCVVLELIDERNGLERILLHFAHFRKEAVRLEKNKYKVTLYYDENDETELVIRVLSFGPMLRVVEPQQFVELIRERLIAQQKLIF